MIFLDLDGVLADFHGAACRVHGRAACAAKKWNFYTDWGLSTEQFWKPIHDMGENFYRLHVRPLPWAEDVMDTVLSCLDEMKIVTCSTYDHAGYSGKRNWVNRHFGDKIDVVILGDKHLLATPDRLLIDDSDQQVDAFANHGGKTHLFPRAWNRNHHLQGQQLDYLESTTTTWSARQHNQPQFSD